MKSLSNATEGTMSETLKPTGALEMRSVEGGYVFRLRGAALPEILTADEAMDRLRAEPVGEQERKMGHFYIVSEERFGLWVSALNAFRVLVEKTAFEVPPEKQRAGTWAIGGTEGRAAENVVLAVKALDGEIPTAPVPPQDVEALTKMLGANGEGGDVEIDNDGEPVFQIFVAQAGPVPRGTPVCVLTQDRSEKICAALRSRTEGAKDGPT